MQDGRSYAEIRAAHPFPWRPVTVPGRAGGITVIDSGNAEVPIFTMLRVLELVTSANQSS